MKSVRTLVLATTFLALGAVISSEQTLLPGTGMVTHVEGNIFLNEQRVEPSNTPLLNSNSVVRTEEGRVEIRLAGGVSLFLGENAAVKLVPGSTSSFSGFGV